MSYVCNTAFSDFQPFLSKLEVSVTPNINKIGQFVQNDFQEQFLEHTLYKDTIECKLNQTYADWSFICKCLTSSPNFTMCKYIFNKTNSVKVFCYVPIDWSVESSCCS